MKVRTLSMLAGVSAPLILTGSSDAGFVGIKTTSKPNDFGLLVVNVYSIFDRPGEDRMSYVAGTPNALLRIEVHNGTFYNHEFGDDMAPSTFLVGLYPSLEFDTFVTIGVKQVGPGGQPKDNLIITPGFPTGITGSVLETTGAYWFTESLFAQSYPFNAPFSFPGNGQIIIGQFSTTNGTAISGTFLIQYTSNGVQFQQSVGSFFHVPGPGALALLGLAGLMGTRRRRR